MSPQFRSFTRYLAPLTRQAVLIKSIMKFTILAAVLIFISVLKSSNGARIFGAFPLPVKSHQCVFRALMEELAKRGHELVVLTTDPMHYTEPEFDNLREIDVHDLSYDIWRKKLNFVKERVKKLSPAQALDGYHDAFSTVAENQLAHPEIQKLIKNREKFDLCFVEGLVPVLAGFKDVFSCALIIINSFPGTPDNYELVGSPTHPIFYFDHVKLYHLNEINFWRRLELLKLRMEYSYVVDWKYHAIYDEMSKKFFGPNVRSLSEIESEVDMVFQNFHPIVSGIRPLVPAIIHMGSMHIKKPGPLPSNVQKVLDDAKNGAVYLSFGSNARSVDLPQEKVTQIINALKGLPYTVLWKWEADDLPNKPQNVFLSKWYPQQSLLAHPNVKLFITQGGQQSLEEAIHYGVPMIGVPFLGDQFGNTGKMVDLGIGKKFLIDDVTSENLKQAVLDIMGNKSYYDNIVKLRDLIYDQPQTPMERAVWWTEYVIRHKGAKHLRSPVAGMSSLEYYLVWDLAIVFAFCVAVIIFAVRTVKYILNMFTPTKKIKKH